MVKFILGLVTGVLLVFLTFILLFFTLLRFREKPPVIADNSVLVLHLSGDIPEKPPLELPGILGGGDATLTVSDLWMMLRKAAADPHIRALVLEPESLGAGWAKLEEIRADLEQFHKTGKPVYAYLRAPSARDYYVALPADRIYLGDEEPVYLKGLRAEIMYFKKSLDKLGVTVEVEHAGKYKDFGDMFTRSDMSPETREVITSLVTNLYGNLVDRIAAARKKTPDQVRAIVDQGPFTAQQALNAGLVDALRFEDQMWGELGDKMGARPVKIAASQYAMVSPESAGLAGHSHIALIVGAGDIVRGGPGDDGSGESSLTSYGFNKLLREVGGDSTIRGVVVRIDSPGGEASASDEIWREMNLLSKKKPVVISMSDVAASGGYYMAMTGDPVVAYPQTETGSIGVVFGKPDLHGLYDKLGVTKDAVQLGKHADIDSDYTGLTPEEREILRQGIDENYRDFVGKVAASRHLSYDRTEPLAQGRVWLGSQAKENGLVDELGGLDTAISLVKKKANIPAGENVTLMVYPPRESLLNMLLKRSTGADALSAMLDARLQQVFGRVPFHAWMKGGMLRMMPVWVDVR
jgi:protease-4